MARNGGTPWIKAPRYKEKSLASNTIAAPTMVIKIN